MTHGANAMPQRIDPGNTATHACSGGTPRGATAVLQGNAGKIEKPSKY